MAPVTPVAQDPDLILSQWTGMLDTFEHTIQNAFSLPENDGTVYEAESFRMTLSEIQNELQSGKYKYHYRSHGQPVIVPVSDINAYTSIFSSTTSTDKALKSFASNAKKGSPRESVAHYLLTKRLMPPTFTISKLKKEHLNPYFDIWTFSCQDTGFLGPLGDKGYADPRAANQAHPILPVLYHHFGCVCPSWEALSVISQLVGKGEEGVLEVGSGNGYWTYLLRRMGVKVIAVDSADASWRTMWISDTVKANGVEYVKKTGGAKDRVLLLVYPVVTGDFTGKVLREYKGDTIVVVGTQNDNRFTGFKDMTLEKWFEQEKGWEMPVRVALPSFAGKDEGLFVFRKKTHS
jgi:hypothetical protein